MRRVLCLLLAAIMVLNVGVSDVYAAERKGKKNGKGEWRQEDYERVNHTLNYLGYDEDDKVYYTEFQETVKDEERVKYVSFIYDDERAIGQYVKEKSDDDVNECFIINKGSQILNELVTHLKGEEFEVCEEEGIMGASPLDGPENKGWGTIKKGSAEYITGCGKTGEFIATGLIENDINWSTLQGLCWAACGASVSNYYRNTKYTANDVWGIVKTAVGTDKLYGTPANVKCMFAKLGIFYTYIEKRLTYSQALSALKKDTLIMYNIQKPIELGEVGHAVLLCGVFNISTSYGYIYMDPNISGGYVLNYHETVAANTTWGDFYYYNGADQYTYVHSTFYNLEKHYTLK